MLQFFVTLQMLVNRRHEDEGATAVEYGLMLALIAAVILVAVTLLGQNVSSMFSKIANVI